MTLLRRRLARYRSVIRNLQVTSWYGSRQRFPAQGSSLSYIGNTAIAGMRLVGRGKKGTNAVSPRKPRDPYSTGIFDPPSRIGRDRTHIAVRVCRDRNAAVASSPISEPREQARKAVDRCGHRQIELRRETLEHRLGDLTPRAGVVVENIPGGGDRAPQVRVTLDPVAGGSQALLARECDGKGRGIRGLDCAQPGDEASSFSIGMP